MARSPTVLLTIPLRFAWRHNAGRTEVLPPADRERENFMPLKRNPGKKSTKWAVIGLVVSGMLVLAAFPVVSAKKGNTKSRVTATST
jgi:hypothetical protein